ncbi:MAG: PEP-CTERM sorting domain-containing protein [Gammaproteobacteria bacterium]|nr:PEP-CTERM sorting domain-containing protein [Gammaproteobacteria bacterium]
MKFINTALVSITLSIQSNNVAAMVATPVAVAEPSTMALFGLGALLIALNRRR